MRRGFFPKTSAATPETCGAAIDVPLRKFQAMAMLNTVAVAGFAAASASPSVCESEIAGIHGVPLFVGSVSVPLKLPGPFAGLL